MTLRNNSGPVKWILIILVILFLAVFLILPLVYILMTALGKGVEVYKASITDKYAVKAIQLTVQATLWAVAVNTIFGIAAAWCLTKYAFRGNPDHCRPYLCPYLRAPEFSVPDSGQQRDPDYLRCSRNHSGDHFCHLSLYIPGADPCSECSGDRRRRGRRSDGGWYLYHLSKSDISPYQMGSPVRDRSLHGESNGRIRSGLRSFGASERKDQYTAALYRTSLPGIRLYRCFCSVLHPGDHGGSGSDPPPLPRAPREKGTGHPQMSNMLQFTSSRRA